jgi:hypothetical protein
MDIAMPSAFPNEEFRAFGLAAQSFFPPLTSEENLSDPLERRRHFEWSWQAVRYRYRICAETADEFKGLLADASDLWWEWGGDEELSFRLERCIYVFFISALSVFESFGFCLYFLGNAIEEKESPHVNLEEKSFPHFNNPKKIKLQVTSAAFTKTFPCADIAYRLAELLQAPEFSSIEALRNVLAHRVSGRLSRRGFSTTHSDGITTSTSEKTWHIPGSSEVLVFDKEMLHVYLGRLTAHLDSLVTAAREFAEGCNSAASQP